MSPPRPACPWPAALAALALLSAGCPIPQSLPEYPSTGTVAPPRIQSDAALPVDAFLPVAAGGCAAAPVFRLSAPLVDENTLEPVDARWFVDYDPGNSLRANPVNGGPDIIEGPADGLSTLRPVCAAGKAPDCLLPFAFRPYDFDPSGAEQAFRDAGGLHVVELVVSNGFEGGPVDQAGLPRPWRTPKAQFETQVHRWVFHYVPAGAGGSCGFPAP